jgi:hypothetical protein
VLKRPVNKRKYFIILREIFYTLKSDVVPDFVERMEDGSVDSLTQELTQCGPRLPKKKWRRNFYISLKDWVLNQLYYFLKEMKYRSIIQIILLHIRFNHVCVSPPAPHILRETMNSWKDKLICAYRRRWVRSVTVQGDMLPDVFLYFCWKLGRVIYKKK